MIILYLKERRVGDTRDIENNNEEIVPPPFDSIIKLTEGIFKWNENDSSYIQLKTK